MSHPRQREPRVVFGFHAVLARLRAEPKSVVEIFLDEGRNDVFQAPWVERLDDVCDMNGCGGRALFRRNLVVRHRDVFRSEVSGSSALP